MNRDKAGVDYIEIIIIQKSNKKPSNGIKDETKQGNMKKKQRRNQTEGIKEAIQSKKTKIKVSNKST